MNGIASRLAGACLLPLILTAGCAAPSAPPGPFPPRPFTIAVDRIDPCAVLTTEQRSSLDLTSGRPGDTQEGTSRGCGWIDRAGRGVSFQTFPAPATRAIGAETQIRTVGGFGAVESTPFRDDATSFCQIVVDVADGASVRSQLTIFPSALTPPDDAVACRELEPITAQMLETLRARQPS